jgi:hypothetical protein
MSTSLKIILFAVGGLVAFLVLVAVAVPLVVDGVVNLKECCLRSSH